MHGMVRSKKGGGEHVDCSTAYLLYSVIPSLLFSELSLHEERLTNRFARVHADGSVVGFC